MNFHYIHEEKWKILFVILCSKTVLFILFQNKYPSSENVILGEPRDEVYLVDPGGMVMCIFSEVISSSPKRCSCQPTSFGGPQ